MKNRLSLIFTALAVILVTLVWVVRDRGSEPDVVMPPAMASAPQIMPAPQSDPMPALAAVAAQVTVTPPIPAAEPPAPKTVPQVHISADGAVNYTARGGDTVSELAVALLGSDSKSNRDAVIAANPSLQANPDRVLDGQRYSIVPAGSPVSTADETTVPAAASATDSSQTVAPETTASSKTPADSTRNMTYTAQKGDSVAVLAGNLLGGNTKVNRDAIINGNASLQNNPDHLVAGKKYTITTTAGLAADPASPQAAAPTTQPEADEAAVLSVGRVLKYTAQSGDTVSKLATVLLGSDTKANRDIIINNNRSLVRDPDHLEAGQTYAIPAPAAIAQTAP